MISMVFIDFSLRESTLQLSYFTPSEPILISSGVLKSSRRVLAIARTFSVRKIGKKVTKSDTWFVILGKFQFWALWTSY